MRSDHMTDRSTHSDVMVMKSCVIFSLRMLSLEPECFFVFLFLQSHIYSAFRSKAESNSTSISKDITTFTKILDSLLDGYDNRLRPGLGGQRSRLNHKSI